MTLLPNFFQAFAFLPNMLSLCSNFLSAFILKILPFLSSRCV